MRVIEIADIPDFKPGQRVDVSKLVEIRESSECRDFREWLVTVTDASDAEIRNAVAGIRNNMAALAGSSSGKAVRFAATTLAGLLPGGGLVLGPVTGAIDSFIIDRVLPRSGILAFLSETYPSLFKSA